MIEPEIEAASQPETAPPPPPAEPAGPSTADAPDEPSGEQNGGPTWEDDENSTTFFLRAAATLLCGCYLAWAQYNAPFSPTSEWNRWVWLSVAANLVLPLGIVWLFFGQGIVHLSWLRDQRSNAWNYGWNFANWRAHLRWTLPFCAVMLVGMIVFRLTPAGKAAAETYLYSYFPPVPTSVDKAKLLLTLAVYMFCWEWFFRGFLLFGMAQGFGPILAVIAQALVFGATHFGKSPIEFASSFAGGAILGAVCWKEKSFAPAFYVHCFVHLAWAIMVI